MHRPGNRAARPADWGPNFQKLTFYKNMISLQIIIYEKWLRTHLKRIDKALLTIFFFDILGVWDEFSIFGHLGPKTEKVA